MLGCGGFVVGCSDSLRDWIGAAILPHEAQVRSWLCRTFADADEVEDILQESYCRFSALEDHRAIRNPRAFFFEVARNIALDHLRRRRIVPLEFVAELDTLGVGSDAPLQDRIAAGRQDLSRLGAIIEALPERCRNIIMMRKLDGLSQKEVARRLGVSENIVENDSARGLRSILDQFAGGTVAPDIERARHEPARPRRRHRR